MRDAARAGCLTLAFAAVGAQCELVPPVTDPLVAQELAETAYHVLWELVHVFFEHRGLLEGRDARPGHDTGASSFLYPFLAEREHDLDAVLADVRDSTLAKAREIAGLRAQTLTENRGALAAAAHALRERLDAGGTVLALGNGGSATDAMDAVADLRDPPRCRAARAGLRAARWTWPADPAILTAIANDIGDRGAVRAPGDRLRRDPATRCWRFSTSGNSLNVIAALAQARARGLASVALVGYDGGRIAAERLADHVVVTRSEHIPRIQEAQASAWHVLRELIEEPA